MRNNGYTARVCVCLPCSEKRVGNVYSKAKSFVDYVRRALRRLELDESKVWIKILQSLTEHLPETHCGERFSENTQRRKRNAHDFGTTGGAMFPRLCLFKYSKSCQVSELDGCLRYSLSCLRALPELSPGFP